MDLNDSDDLMTPLFPEAFLPESEPELEPEPEPEPEPKPKISEQCKAHKKNIHKVKMDSTPLSEVMGGLPDVDLMAPQNPRGSAPPYAAQQAMMAPPPSSAKPSAKPAAPSYPLNLTKEQVEALLAGFVAVGVFTGVVQEKLASTVPNFLDAMGKRSTVGMLVTALLAAVLYYFARRMVLPSLSS